MVTTAATTTPPATAAPRPPDPQVCVAAALGWQMAELYNEVRPPRPWVEPLVDPPDLPGVSALGSRELLMMRVQQVRDGVARLRGTNAAQIDGSISTDVAAVSALIDQANNGIPDGTATAVQELHGELLSRLTAVDARIGKAYGLGRALADISLRPKASTKAELISNFAGRSERIKGWLRDLKSSLPDHASEAIGLSLDQWRDWLDRTDDGAAIWTQPAGWNDPVHPEQTQSLVTFTLVAQGDRWRSLLTGEKDATDSLTADDYVVAGDALIQRLLNLIWQFMSRYWPVVLLILVVIAASVTVAILLSGGTAGVVAGLGALAGGLGITWKNAQSTLGSVFEKARGPLWGAQLDLAVARAITTLPGDQAVELHVPPSRLRSILLT